jgi:hypothetical protein
VEDGQRGAEVDSHLRDPMGRIRRGFQFGGQVAGRWPKGDEGPAPILAPGIGRDEVGMGGAGHPATEQPATIVGPAVASDFHGDGRGSADLTVVGFVHGYGWSAGQLSMKLVPGADEIG